jgi:molybdate transport system substrate-binding protein
MSRIILAALLAAGIFAPAAELKILSVGSIDPGLTRNAEAFQKTSGHHATIQVDTAPGITRRLAAGETADILIAPANVLDDAAKAGKIVAGTRAPVARVGIGVTVRKGATNPNVRTTDVLKQTLERVDSVVYNEGSSGLYLEKLFEQMGLGDRLKPKTTRYPNGGQVAQHVVGGKGVELGFLPISYIKSNESIGLQYVGPLPADVQNYTAYEAAVMSGGSATDAAKEFIRYLTTAAAKQIFASTGVE